MIAQTAKPNIITYRIPFSTDEDRVKRLGQKYKELRLTSLRLSPECFASNLAAEEKYEDAVWESRFRKEHFQTFVCAVAPTDEPEWEAADVTDKQLDWISLIGLHGPISVKNFTLPLESGQEMPDPVAETTEERWQFFGLYNLPVFRGQRIAERMAKASLDWLQTDRLTQPHIEVIRCRAMVLSDNKPSLSFCRKMGFVDMGKCTVAEIMFANGDSVPADWEETDPRRCDRSHVILRQDYKKYNSFIE